MWQDECMHLAQHSDYMLKLNLTSREEVVCESNEERELNSGLNVTWWK
jgi:hypothetical protein